MSMRGLVPPPKGEGDREAVEGSKPHALPPVAITPPSPAGGGI
jgi:hypothetical protein